MGNVFGQIPRRWITSVATYFPSSSTSNPNSYQRNTSAGFNSRVTHTNCKNRLYGLFKAVYDYFRKGLVAPKAKRGSRVSRWGSDDKSPVRGASYQERHFGPKLPARQTSYKHWIFDFIQTLWHRWLKGGRSGRYAGRTFLPSSGRSDGEPWWERLSKTKQSARSPPVSHLRTFTWWSPERQSASWLCSVSSRSFDLQAHVDRLCQPRQRPLCRHCAALLAAERATQRSPERGRAISRTSLLEVARRRSPPPPQLLRPGRRAASRSPLRHTSRTPLTLRGVWRSPSPPGGVSDCADTLRRLTHYY